MLDFMQKYRPVFAAPDAPVAGDVAPAAPAADSGAAAPVAEAAPVAGAEAAAADGAAAPETKSEPSLLEAAKVDTKSDAAPEGKADAKADAKPEGADKEAPAPAPESKDAKADGDKKPEAEAAKKDEGKTDPAKKDATADTPPAPIAYQAFTLPEDVKLDDERLKAFTDIAGPAQVSQEIAQQFMSLHVAEMQRVAKDIQEQATKNQHDVWNKLNDTWKTDSRKEFGNRIDTTLSRSKAVIEEYGGSPEQVRELIAHTTSNGMGNFPGFLRFLDNVAEALNVFEESAATNNAGPPKSAGNRSDKWYPNSNMNGGAKA